MFRGDVARRLSSGIIALLSVSILFMLVSGELANARRGKKHKVKAGVLDGRKYTDKKYGFSLTFPENWDISVGRKDAKVRVVAEKEDYAVPVSFRNAPYHTTVPKIKVYVDTTSLELLDFIDSLKSGDFSSPQKSEIMNEFKVFEGKFRRPRISRIRLDNGIKGRWFRTVRNYSINVQNEGAASTATIVQDAMAGDIAMFKKGNTLILISGECEGQFYEINQPRFVEVAKSLEFTDDKDK